MVNDKRDTCVQFSVGGTKMKKIGYKHTVAASFTAFVVQAVVNNFAPLLFLTFQAQYGIELSKITVLITANFFIQIFVDLTAVLFVDRIGYRASTVLAPCDVRDRSYFHDDSAGDTALGFRWTAYLRVLLRGRSGSFGYHDKSDSQLLPVNKFQSAALPAPFVLLLGQRRGGRHIHPVLRPVLDG